MTTTAPELVVHEEMKFPKSLIIIPARMGSGRLPGKPLITAGEKALVCWTYEQAEKVQNSTVVVATPDSEISQYCEVRGILCFITNHEHPTGTHRCAEVANGSWKIIPTDVDVIVNWQCDEPLVDPGDVEKMILSAPNWIAPIRTLVSKRFPDEDPLRPDSVKAVVSDTGRCLWFSRAPLAGALYHIGVYAYSLQALNAITLHQPTRLSLAERLEQLSWIERGHTIEAVEIECTRLGRCTLGPIPLAINTKNDFREFRKIKEGVLER